MKKILMTVLSCVSLMAAAQNSKTDNSLDGRSFRITLKEKATETSMYQRDVPGNQTGVNTGTINSNTTMQHNDTHGTTNTDPNSNRDRTDVQTGGTMDTTNPNNMTGTTGNPNDQNTTGNTMDSNNSGTTGGTATTGSGTTGTQNQTGVAGTTDTRTSGQYNTGTTATAEVGDLNNKTMSIRFNDGMLMVGTKNPDKNIKADNVNSDSEEKEILTGCKYSITSGSGSLSTFTASCTSEAMNTGTTGTQDNGTMGTESTEANRGMVGKPARSTAYWNGYVNESGITGNLVIYTSDGMSKSYSFTGKATKNDTMRKSTSSR